MQERSALVFGSGHLAARIEKLLDARGERVVRLSCDEGGAGAQGTLDLSRDGVARALDGLDPRSLATICLVDDHDERNLGFLIALLSLEKSLPVTIALFNEDITPHLRAANPNVRILNPARIAAPAFIAALDTPLHPRLQYAPVPRPDATAPRADPLLRRLLLAFLGLIAVAVVFFHFANGLSWLDSVYFVVVTVATVGYGDISLLDAGARSKVFGIGLILVSTFFIWMTFSLTVDGVIKRRAQLALGRSRYAYRDHVILCGLGRLGFLVAEGLLARGERVVVVERNADAPRVDYVRGQGADVYIGDARLPRVLGDVGADRARALYSLVDNDFANLEIGLSAQSFNPQLRVVLRIFDESMAAGIRDSLDIQLTFSMSAIADEEFVAVRSTPGS